MITSIPMRIVVLAPFATRSSDTGDVGIDLPLARTADGRVMIPGTHVIGKLRASLRELHALLDGDPLAETVRQDLSDLLPGGDWDEAGEADRRSTGREVRRTLTASDFVLESAAKGGGTRTRIAIDNVRSTVLDGMMQVVEQPFATGQELEFKGHVRVIGQLTDTRKRRIIKALQFVTQMGALRTVGYGEVVSVAEEKGAPVPAQPELPKVTTRLLARLRFEDVFCAGEARNTPNTYTSADFVPGGVIKGAIARQMLASAGRDGFLDDPQNRDAFGGDLAILARDFGLMRVRHAQPVPKGAQARPCRAIPDSLVAVEGPDGPVIVDLAGLDEPDAPVLIDGQVPIAPFDWKDAQRDAARSLLSVAHGPNRVLRVRTEVWDKTRAARTGRLFGIEYTRGDEHDFLAEIDLSASPAPDAMVSALQTVLAHGLAGIGRSGAYAGVTLEPIEKLPLSEPAPRAVAVLQSAALLRDPSRPAVNLREAYADAFAELGLPETIRLSAVFVRERLAGGGFFRNRLVGMSRAYAPWLLTEPGATFVFEATDGGAVDPSWLFPDGLGVPQRVLLHHGLEDVGALYRACPYLPENGYGELVINPLQLNGDVLWASRSPRSLNLRVENVGALSPEWQV